jgi:hypothetical protein
MKKYYDKEQICLLIVVSFGTLITFVGGKFVVVKKFVKIHFIFTARTKIIAFKKTNLLS